MAQLARTIFEAQLKQNLLRLQRQIDLADSSGSDARLHSQLFKAIEFGLKVPLTVVLAANLLIASIEIVLQGVQWPKWIPLYEHALATTSLPNGQKSQLLNQFGSILQLLGRFETSLEIHQQAIDLAVGTADFNQLAKSYAYATDAACAQFQLEKAANFCQQAQILQTQITDEVNAMVQQASGRLKLNLGDYKNAIQLFLQALTYWDTVDKSHASFVTHINCGIAYARNEQINEALQKYDEALHIAQCLMSRTGQVQVLLNKSALYLHLESYRQALAFLEDAHTLYLHDSVDLVQQAKVNHNLGFTLFKLERYEEAIIYLERSEHIWLKVDDMRHLSNTLGDLARTHLKLGNLPIAIKQLTRSIELLQPVCDDVWALTVLEDNQQLLNRLTGLDDV